MAQFSLTAVSCGLLAPLWAEQTAAMNPQAGPRAGGEQISAEMGTSDSIFVREKIRTFIRRMAAVCQSARLRASAAEPSTELRA